MEKEYQIVYDHNGYQISTMNGSDDWIPTKEIAEKLLARKQKKPYFVGEKLYLIDSHHLHALHIDVQENLGRVVHGRGNAGVLVVGDHLHLVIARVDRGLEELDLLVGELRTSNAAQQLLCFPRKHRTANHLNPSFFVVTTGFIL